MTKKILIFSPYGGARCHTSYEVTIATGLRLRGADVHFICCNGVYPDCDAHWVSSHPRDEGSCHRCMQLQHGILTPFGFQYDWLGSYLDGTTLEQACEWVNNVADEELFIACYKDYPLGTYAKSSVHSHFRSSELEISNPETRRTFRNYLYGAVLTFEGMSRVMNEYQPDVIIMFNGRFFNHRTVLELARKASIKVYVHERGRLDNSLTIWEDESCHGFKTVLENWSHWKDVPLKGNELEQIEEIFRQRREGENTGWYSFVSPKQEQNDIFNALRIPHGSKIVTLYTSSEDEFAAFEDKDSIIDQYEWIERTVRYFKGEKEVFLVVRLHPNTYPGDLFLMKINLLRMALPQNVRIVMPEEKINSYQLAEISQSALFFLSRMVAEVAVMGKPVLIIGNGLWYGHPFAINPPDNEGYEQHLKQLLDADFSLESVRWAYRFSYHYYVRTNIPFPLVFISDVFNVRLAYDTSHQLLPGRDEALDRICEAILNGGQLYPIPSDLSAPSQEEETFLQKQAECLQVNSRRLKSQWADTTPQIFPEKILLVCHSLPPHEFSGTPLITLEQASEMQKSGVQVAVLIADQQQTNGFVLETINGLTVFKVPAIDRNRVYFDDSCKMAKWSDYLHVLGEIIGLFSPDIVHINDAVDMPPVIVQFFSDRGAVVVREVWNDEEICFRISPLIAETKELCSGPENTEKCEICYYKTSRDSATPPFFTLDPSIRPGIESYSRYIRYLYARKIHGVIFSSLSFKEHITKFIPIEEGKCVLIPHGTTIRNKMVSIPDAGSRTEITFSFMGNIYDYRKGLDLILDAFEELSHLQGFRLAIYGSGGESNILQRIEKLQRKCGGKITYQGPYKPEDIPAMMERTDVGIVPSRFESYSRVLREFIGHGVPVITSDFFGSELIINGYNGFKIGIGDSSVLRRKMEEIINSPALLRQITAGAKDTPLATMETEVGCILDYFAWLLTKKRSSETSKVHFSYSEARHSC